MRVAKMDGRNGDEEAKVGPVSLVSDRTHFAKLDKEEGREGKRGFVPAK